MNEIDDDDDNNKRSTIFVFMTERFFSLFSVPVVVAEEGMAVQLGLFDGLRVAEG